ncbi:MAG: aspartate dehydrogenase domain-containing protein [Candidatus Thorarchaeota archaeon]
MKKQVGLIGYGRIGAYIHTKSKETGLFEIGFVYEPDKTKTTELDSSIILHDPEEIFSKTVDLIVEAADFRVVRDYANRVLKRTDLMILSVTALADKKLYGELLETSVEYGTRLLIPHGALLGMDGLYDTRGSLEEVQIITVKNPKNIDFNFTDEWSPDMITERTVLYDGPTRGICGMFPRNVNAHAVVALSALGFDRTHSTLISDPHSDDALQHIIAKGGGTVLEVKRTSVIKGVTGEFTLISIYGSIERAIGSLQGMTMV